MMKAYKKGVAFLVTCTVAAAMAAEPPKTVDQLFELRARMFPEDGKDADPYPDNLTQPIVNIPDGVKYRKVKAAKRNCK